MTSQSSRPAAIPLWLLILAAGTIVGIAAGRAQVMGLYLVPMTKALDIGRETLGFTMALSQLMIGVAAPFSGALMDKYGAARMVIACTLLTMLGLYLMYAATTVAMLIVSGVLMGLGVSGTGFTSLVGTVGRLAPPEKRLAAIASLGMASGIGGFLALPYVHVLIEYTGWQTSLLLLLATTAAMIPLAWPLRGRPIIDPAAPPKQKLRDALAEAFAHPSFWLLTAGFFVCGFHVAFIAFHLPAFTEDQGLPKWVGPTALSVVGIANIIGTFAAGRSGRYFEKRIGLSLIYFGRALVFLGFLLLPPTSITVIALSAALGLLWLSTIPLTSGLVATFFGTTWMSMLFGIVFLSHQVGSFLGVWIAGRLFDTTKSYDTMWMISIGLGLVAALLNWPIKERPVARIAASTA